MAKNEFMQNLATMPLYEEVLLDLPGKRIIEAYMNHADLIEDDSIDIYCIHCKEQSIFKPYNAGQIHSGYVNYHAFKTRQIPYGGLHFSCTRNQAHIFEMQIINIDENIIVKIGQYPSKADLESPNLNKYSSIIPSRYLSDIKRAVGLSAHGIGAGSFVYLRRVIEYLINDAYEEAKKDDAFDQEEYQKSRFVEKMLLLKEYLPDILIQNKEAYSILSKGVHELEENECLESIGLLSATIELILEEMLNEKQRKEREKVIKSGISNLHSQIKNKST